MEIQLPLTINTEEAVLNCIKILSSVADDEIFISYSKKIKAIITKTGDLKHQIYFKSKYDEVLLKRREKLKGDLLDKNYSILKNINEKNKTTLATEEEIFLDNGVVKGSPSLAVDVDNNILNQREKSEELRNRIFYLAKENSRLLSFEKVVQSELKDKEEEIEAYKRKILNLEKNFKDSKNNYTTLQTRYAQLRNTDAQGKEEILSIKNNSSTTIELQKIVISNLKRQLDSYKSLKLEKSTLISIIEEIKLGSQEKSLKILSEMYSKLEYAKNEIYRLTEEKESIRVEKSRENKRLFEENRKLINEINSNKLQKNDLLLKNKVKSLGDDLVLKNQEIEKIKKDNKERIQTLEVKNKSLKKDLDKLKEENKITKNEGFRIDIVLSDKLKLEKEIEKLKREKEDYKKRLENCQKELRKHGLIPTTHTSNSTHKSLVLENSDKVSYKGGISEDGSVGFGNERRESGKMGSLSSFDNYNDDFNETYPNEYY